MATKKKGNGKHLPTFKDIVERVARALKIPENKRRVVLSERWNLSKPLYHACNQGRRRPQTDAHPKFFADAQKYGAAEFTEKGAVIGDTLGKGPEPLAMFHSMAPGSDKRVAERRSGAAAGA